MEKTFEESGVKLLPCPFCGRPPHFKVYDMGKVPGYSGARLLFEIRCNPCNIIRGQGTLDVTLDRSGKLAVSGDSRLSAANIWNERRDSPAE